MQCAQVVHECLMLHARNSTVTMQNKFSPNNHIIIITFFYFFILHYIQKQLNIFERKVYRRILGPVYDIEKENWRVLINREIYASVKKPTIIETVRLNRLRWFGHIQRMEENRIPKRVLYMNLETTRLRGRPRNR